MILFLLKIATFAEDIILPAAVLTIVIALIFQQILARWGYALW